ncbi:MAG: hypothetical protein LBM56_01460, partial [Burkholderiaceae bacterium]|nr:hypothetical protein [Burkholderiaceae bacterium]
MKRFAACFFMLILTLGLSGCAAFSPPPEPGASEDEIISRYGNPTAIYPDGDTVLWEYAGGYWSQQTWMAKINKNHRLISWEEVRTDARFATLVIGKSTKTDVLKTVGQPTETSRIHLNNYEVWSYRYLQDGVWDAMMHLMFDEQGIFRKMETGLDPADDYDDGGIFGRMRRR